MNCHEIENLLSPYLDGELSEDKSALVADHLAECEACSGELVGFQDLSQVAQTLDAPQVPTEMMWEELTGKLDTVNPVPWWQFSWLDAAWLQPRRQLAVAMAACLFLAAFASGIWLWNASHGEHGELAAHFDAFLDEFPQAPKQAQRVLLVNYEGKDVTLNEASQAIGYTPLAGANVPAGYEIENIYLLDMPCCRCAQIVYRSPDGRRIAIFEHDIDQPMWFGDRPKINCKCNGRPANLFQVNGQTLAASCKIGERYVTLIGAKDLDEVSQLMGELTGQDNST